MLRWWRDKTSTGMLRESRTSKVRKLGSRLKEEAKSFSGRAVLIKGDPSQQSTTAGAGELRDCMAVKGNLRGRNEQGLRGGENRDKKEQGLSRRGRQRGASGHSVSVVGS